MRGDSLGDRYAKIEFWSFRFVSPFPLRTCVLVLLFYQEHGEVQILDAATTAVLRAVREEVRENVSRNETGIRAHVAIKLLEAATRGERTRAREGDRVGCTSRSANHAALGD